MNLLKKIFGTSSAKEVKRLMPIVDQIERLSKEYDALSNPELQAKTPEFKARLANGETLDDILPEAFAALRVACDRVLGMRPYPVQLIGGIVLHQGRIAEMKTGEGKTLVATLPAYLNALAGSGVHIVTVNDYLAKRDSEWMGKVYRFMGLTVGLIVHGLTKEQRKAAYAADITYGTNNEMGFDYLRDNMAIYDRELVQRGHVFAIVDEVDSILIDEARTPLIISGKGEESTALYTQVDRFVRGLRCQRIAETDDKQLEDEDSDADYIVEEKGRHVTLTPKGIAKAEAAFGLENLSDPENTTLNHHINQAIRAHGIMKRDVDYVVKDGQVIIVDEFTGRLMFGRRYNEGLHQAIEAKEGVTVANESKTLATITFQNFFRLYDKLSGMTGTAMTEEEEFASIYGLDIVEIPTNKPVARVDNQDRVYKSEPAKYRAIIAQIEECHKKGQPVLVGTISIEKSELISKMLKSRGIPHNVLNAKQHEKEAEIIAQAGKLGSVTVATNMAGRGTDIMLGGNAEYLAKAELRKAGYSDEVIAEATGFADTDDAEVLAARKLFAESQDRFREEIRSEAEQVRAAGGLYILGTERHESRRIDNQLRGRAGRQGDPGETCFFLSLEDDILRLFGGDRIQGLMSRLPDDMPIEAKMISSTIENAQRKVESKNFQTRKDVLSYDDVMNTQREVIYEQRRKVLSGEDLKDYIATMIRTIISRNVTSALGEQKHLDAETWQSVTAEYRNVFLTPDELNYTEEALASMSADDLIAALEERAFDIYAKKEAILRQRAAEFEGQMGDDPMRELERVILLRVVDEYWMENIDAMDDLKQGIRLRAYGQEDPVVAYKREGYEMFEAMIAAIQEETVKRIYTTRVVTRMERKAVAKVTGESGGSDGSLKKQPVRKGKKIGRNDPCPCGSGLKWKKCTCKEYHEDLNG